MNEPINLDSFPTVPQMLAAAKKVRGKWGPTYRFYASYKARAISCRLRGKTSNALFYESMADKFYQKLPKELQW